MTLVSPITLRCKCFTATPFVPSINCRWTLSDFNCSHKNSGNNLSQLYFIIARLSNKPIGISVFIITGLLIFF